MPLVEEEVGQQISRLIERNVSRLKHALGWKDVSGQQGHWLLKSVFWLVSAKILRDKRVASFEDLVLTDVHDVFSRLSAHYGAPQLKIRSKRELAALEDSAQIIDRCASLALTTTESLGYVYENTLISKETRSSLGTHSTPSFLVDYIVASIADWVEELPEHSRNVFEPACGHAAFLVSAMRLLTQLLPADKAVPSRRGPYLRSRLHGTERDPFALEIARLSLTLSDIPNPDGWDLRVEDMFVSESLSSQARGKTIILANPPFENFTTAELQKYQKMGHSPAVHNKTVEVMQRVLPAMSPGGAFGFVVPQTMLSAPSASTVRKFLAENCELREVILFPDKVFSFSDAESAVLIGRKLPDGTPKPHLIKFRRVHEKQLSGFRENYDTPPPKIVAPPRFKEDSRWDMRVPDLSEVWSFLSTNSQARDFVDIMQGFAFKGKGLPSSSLTYSESKFPGAIQGYIHFDRRVLINDLPTPYWVNLDNSVILHKRSGTTTGLPQVLLNYARVSRGPWRIKALIDRTGHPVASRFITVRPRQCSLQCSLESIWAIFNSPVANAYAFTHLPKRDNLVGDIRNMPMPSGGNFSEIERRARAYFSAVTTDNDPGRLRDLLMQVDLEVLRQYKLPVGLEYALLTLFTGEKRVGVPFKQDHYIPPEIDRPISLSRFLQYEADWPAANKRRGELIDRDLDGTLSPSDADELETLEAFADWYLKKVMPRPNRMLDEIARSVSHLQKHESKG